MGQRCNGCNGNGLGYASAMFADDVEEQITMVNPVYAHLPEPVVASNPVADLVVASFDAQAPTSGIVARPMTNDAPTAAPAEQPKGGVGKLVLAGLGVFVAWKLLG